KPRLGRYSQLKRGNCSNINNDNIRKAIQSLGESILEDSIRVNGKVTTWNVVNFNDGCRSFLIRPMKPDLYGGKIGVALFLACAYRTVGDIRFRDAACEVCDGVIRSIDDSSLPEESKVSGLGAIGIGGLIYGLVSISRLLRDDLWISVANQIAQRIPLEGVLSDASLDVIDGHAGLGLALLLLRRSCEVDSKVEELIQASADCLVLRHKSSGPGWKTDRSSVPLTGFSHGAAGIAYFLAKYSQDYRNDEAAFAAKQAIDYENNWFDHVNLNWRDLRNGVSKVEFMNSWCHGATGIGLSRLATMEYTGWNYADDVEYAISSLQKENPVDSFDSLCCGNAGRLDFILEYLRVNRANMSWHHGNEIVKQLLNKKSVLLTKHAKHPRLRVGLFRGVSGIGYALARYLSPEEIPCLLSWS
ncbi:MAG: hypothetical protein NXI22_10815, partial [bacterium]|nr:hypothetical protein [bacterium]